MSIATDTFYIDKRCVCCAKVNNQLFGTVHPIMLYVPAASDDDDDGGTEPALQISTRKMPSGKWDAYLFRVRTQTTVH